MNATGRPVGPGFCGNFFGKGTEYDCGPLPASGNPYRLEVIDWQRNDTGAYRLHLYRLPAATACENSALACGVTQPGTIADPLDKHLYSFTLPPGDWPLITLVETAPSGALFEPTWRLLDASGRPVGQGFCGNFFGKGSDYDCGLLPASGNPYRIEVIDWQRNDTERIR